MLQVKLYLDDKEAKKMIKEKKKLGLSWEAYFIHLRKGATK